MLPRGRFFSARILVRRCGAVFRSRTIFQPFSSSSGCSMYFTVRSFQSPPQLDTTICFPWANAGRPKASPAPATAKPAPMNCLRFISRLLELGLLPDLAAHAMKIAAEDAADVGVRVVVAAHELHQLLDLLGLHERSMPVGPAVVRRPRLGARLDVAPEAVHILDVIEPDAGVARSHQVHDVVEVAEHGLAARLHVVEEFAQAVHADDAARLRAPADPVSYTHL